MSGAADPGDLEDGIRREASLRGIRLAPDRVQMLARHALAVIQEGKRLHLTTVLEVRDLLDRHIGESFEGAALVAAGTCGTLVDLGSGNGYPGIPVAASHPGLQPILVDASTKKCTFLRGVLSHPRFGNAVVIERQVQRAADLEDLGPIEVLTLRAVGGWQRLLPKIASCVSETGRVLLWAGSEVDSVRERAAWRRLVVTDRVSLPQRGQSWIWTMRRK